MVSVGWLATTDEGVFIPKFDKWLSDAAKVRLQRTLRQRSWRESSPDEKPEGPLERLIRRWNALKGVASCRAATPRRRQLMSARMRDKWWRENWEEALERVAASRFCTGGGRNGWRADIDWFLRPNTVAQLLEGKYDDRPTESDFQRGRVRDVREGHEVSQIEA
jgi:hypothetical protein